MILNASGESISAPENEPVQVLNLEQRFPILLTEETKLLGQFSYKNEVISNVYSENGEEWEDEFKLQKSELSVILLHSLNRRNSLTAQLGFSSSSTRFFSTNPAAYTYSFTTLFEHQANRRKKYGMGLAVRYQGRLSMFPLFMYKEDFGNKWSADVLLPAKAQLIYRFSKADRFMIGYRATTGSYFLGDAYLSSANNLLYQRINVNPGIGYERMLTKFMGIGMDAGVSIPVRSRIRDWSDNNRVLHNFQSQIAPHVNVRLFFALPD